MTPIVKNVTSHLAVTAIILAITVAYIVIGFMQHIEHRDGRTREQLVERGLAEYVIVDAQTGKTEWRWKE